jgi:4-diphosphocytidyl-2-C-methyl-D-erythritol kinase
MLAFPNAKINLGLRILRKRPDGFHEIDSCFYPIGWADALELLPAEATGFSSSGIAIDGDPLDNLCMRAYRLLAADHPLPPVRMHLHKAVPIGAGMGGGSADGAFALRLLDEAFGLGLGEEALCAYAARMGSDCPFFVANRPAMVSGRGEILQPASLSLAGWHLAVAYPNLHISTKEAYAGIVPAVPEESVAEVLALPAEEWEGRLRNDFEASLFPKYPQLPALKQAFYGQGAVYASMTGSGSAVFGLFRNDPGPLAFPMPCQSHAGTLP